MPVKTLAPMSSNLALSAMLLSVPAWGADAPEGAKPSAPKTDKDDKAKKKSETLDTVVVEAKAEKELSSPKYTESLKDTPQTITVVPQKVMQQQNASTLAQVLKNSPGISMQAGEGGAPNGDNLSIRGFNARTDMFINGVRDFGGYARDPFNVEQVEIVKGPSSSNMGRGSTGGSINLVTKTPKKESFYNGTISGGTDAYQRLTLDINQSLDDGDGKDGLENAAFRINAMGFSADAPGRDVVENKRMGIAPSITFGLGTPTQLTLEYFHMEQDNMPDYGIPWVPANVAAANPGTLGGYGDKIAPVSYRNFYGLNARDHEEVDTDIGSINFVHDFENGVTLSNRAQYGVTHRDQVVTPPRFDGTTDQIRRTDVKSRDQGDTILANQTNLLFEFSTGEIKHKLATGVEVYRETSVNDNRVESNPAGVPDTDLFNPNPNDPYNSSMVYDGATAELKSTTLSAYLFDTVDFDEHWTWMGGARFDRYDADYVDTSSTGTGNVRTSMGRTDNMVSWRTSLTFKPAKNGAIYAAYGTSFDPSTDTSSLTPLTSPARIATARSNYQLAPEESRTVELGTKWNLFDGDLLLSGALFQTTKTNARTADPADPTVVTLTGEQRVQGVELGATGHLTKEWSVIGGYTWMDSEVLESGNPAEQGMELANTPQHSLSLWTTYEFPFGLDIGGGATYVGSRFSNNSNTRKADGYVTFDAMAAYHVNNHFILRLNAYNLADEKYLGSVGGGHSVPGAGRSAVLSAEFSF